MCINCILWYLCYQLTVWGFDVSRRLDCLVLFVPDILEYALLGASRGALPPSWQWGANTWLLFFLFPCKICFFYGFANGLPFAKSPAPTCSLSLNVTHLIGSLWLLRTPVTFLLDCSLAAVTSTQSERIFSPMTWFLSQILLYGFWSWYLLLSVAHHFNSGNKFCFPLFSTVFWLVISFRRK